MAAGRIILVSLLGIFFSLFMVRKLCFCGSDTYGILFEEHFKGSSINLKESFTFASLWNKRKDIWMKPQSSLVTTLMLLLSGDVELCPGPFTELKDLVSTSGFKIVHQNVCGLIGKKDILSDILLSHKHINIFGVTETLLKPTLPPSLIEITGYIFERRDRDDANGGGVGVYIKEGTNYLRRTDLEVANIECIWLEILLPLTKSFIIGILYRPPDSSKHLNKNFNNTFCNRLASINSENKEIIVLGDINCDYLKAKDHHELKDSLTLNGFKQLIKKATRITEHSRTLIDVILTTQVSNISKSDVIPSDLSDHDMIACVRKLNNIKNLPKTVKCRNYKNYDAKKVCEELNDKNWNTLYNISDTNCAWNYLKNILRETIDLHAPIITKRVKGISSPWLTEITKREMNIKDKLLRKCRRTNRQADWSNYRFQRNKVNNLVKSAKRTYSRALLSDTAKNPDKFWKAIKRVFPSKTHKPADNTTFNINGKHTTNKKEIAEQFCLFFTHIANNLKSKTILLKDFVWNTPKSTKCKTTKMFKFKPVLVAEVFKFLKQLKRNKAAGIDDLPLGFLKDTAKSVAKPLCHIINLSLKSGIVPSDFKYGRVTPAFKSGQKSDMDNYRPISVLSCVSKIFEKCVYQQTIEYLESNKLLSNTQFGFRSQRNTELAATLFVDEIRKSMNEGCLMGAVFVDLSKAFDTVSHSQLLSKLPSFGINGIELELFTDYLFHRKQKMVNFNSADSEKHDVTCGVPQGSILGPLLFILHFNDICDVPRKCKIIKYADDTVLYFSDKKFQVIENTLNSDFSSVADWLESNELIINLKKGKTECMLFGTTKRILNNS